MKEIRLYFIDDCPFFLPPILPTAYLPTYLPHGVYMRMSITNQLLAFDLSFVL